MVGSKKYLILLIVSTIILGCNSVPIRKLTYLGKFDYQGIPLINGCYYKIGPRIIYNRPNMDTLNDFKIHFLVFYSNGLLKEGHIGVDDSSTIERDIFTTLEKFKERKSFWGTYKTDNDTIFTQQIKSQGMAPMLVFKSTGIFINDTILWIFKENHEKPLGTINVDKKYRFLKFNQLPDSTGYLYDKLQKRMRKNKN